jgi:hypothetical protein
MACLVGVGSFPSHSRHTGTRALLGRWAALLLVAAAAGGMLAAPAGAGLRQSAADQVAFYGDIGGLINSPCDGSSERKQLHAELRGRQADDEPRPIDAVEPGERSRPQGLPMLAVDHPLPPAVG